MANNRVAYGLCKKYNIELPSDATPKEAWEALKKNGIDISEETENDIKDDGVRIPKSNREISDNFNKKVSRIGTMAEYDTKYIMGNLSDSEMQVFDATKDIAIYKVEEGSVSHYNAGSKVIECGEDPTALDKELGYDSAMHTLFHEYGHGVDYEYERQNGIKISQLTECKQAYSDDLMGFVINACEEAGVPLALNFSTMTGEQLQAIENKLNSVYKADKEIDIDTSFLKLTPRKPHVFIAPSREEIEKTERERDAKKGIHKTEEEFQKGVDNLYEAYVDMASDGKEEMEKYEKEKAEYDAYVSTPEYKHKLQELERARAEQDKQSQKHNAQQQRLGIVTDFLGEMSDGEIDVVNLGYWGHSTDYYKRRNGKRGMETWATFFSMKTTRDVEGLNMMKELLPSTYKAYTKAYDSLPKKMSYKRMEL